MDAPLLQCKRKININVIHCIEGMRVCFGSDREQYWGCLYRVNEHIGNEQQKVGKVCANQPYLLVYPPPDESVWYSSTTNSSLLMCAP